MIDLACYYEVLVHTISLTTLVPVVSLSYYQRRRKDNHFLLEIAQPEESV